MSLPDPLPDLVCHWALADSHGSRGFELQEWKWRLMCRGNSSPRGGEALAQATRRLWVPYVPSRGGDKGGSWFVPKRQRFCVNFSGQQAPSCSD